MTPDAKNAPADKGGGATVPGRASIGGRGRQDDVRGVRWTIAAGIAAVTFLVGVLTVEATDEDIPPTTTTIVPQVETAATLPPIPPLTAGEVGPGGFVTRLSNVVQPNGVPLAFDHPVSGQAWTPAEPTVLTVPHSGWWRVGVNLTTLGMSYGGPPNDDVGVYVVRNWNPATPYLTSTIAGERFHNGDKGWNAEINSILQPVWLDAGDRLEVVTVGGPDGLLIESNPSDGLPSGFPTDEGPGTLSPHFYLLPL